MKWRLLIPGLAVAALMGAQVGKAQKPPKESMGYTFTELRSVNLVVGRKLRLCLHRIEPGGIVAWRDDGHHPAVSYVLKGRLTLRQAGMPDQVLQVGEGLAEAKDSPPHWLVNNTNEPVEFIEADIFKAK